MRRCALLSLLVPAAVLAGCGGSSSSSSTNANDLVAPGQIAKVGSRVITRPMVVEIMRQAIASRSSSAGGTAPAVGSQEYLTLREQAVGVLVRDAQIREGARRVSVAVSTGALDKAVTAVEVAAYPGKTAGTVDRAKLNAALGKAGTSEALLRSQVEGVELTKLIRAKVTAAVKVTDKQVADQYAKDKTTVYTSDTRKLRHILVAAKDKALAVRLSKQLQTSDANFAVDAAKYSTDTSNAKTGGDLGDKPKSDWVPEFGDAAWKLAVNQVSDPVKTQFGWHVIEALSPIKKTVKPLDATLKAQIKTTLLTQAQDATLRTWFQRVQGDLVGQTTYAPGFGPAATAPTALGQ